MCKKPTLFDSIGVFTVNVLVLITISISESENLDHSITDEIFLPTPRRFTMTQTWPPRKFGKSLASDVSFINNNYLMGPIKEEPIK